MSENSWDSETAGIVCVCVGGGGDSESDKALRGGKGEKREGINGEATKLWWNQ